jgi:predicted nucleotidyltransferase
MKELSAELLDDVTHRIVSAIHPEQIVLFGSHVWGQPTEDSDVDLLIVLDHFTQPAYRHARDVYRSLRGVQVPVEVLVLTHDQATRAPTSLERKILTEGRVLHG